MLTATNIASLQTAVCKRRYIQHYVVLSTDSPSSACLTKARLANWLVQRPLCGLLQHTELVGCKQCSCKPFLS